MKSKIAKDLLLLGAIILGWLALQLWILPACGVKT
jgi:hypothetical protein